MSHELSGATIEHPGNPEDLFEHLERMLADAEAMLSLPEVQKLQELDALAERPSEDIDELIADIQKIAKKEGEPTAKIGVKPGPSRELLAPSHSKC